MTVLTKQARLDRGNHLALEMLRRQLSAEQNADLAHNDVVTEALGALAVQRPDLAPVIASARQHAPEAAVAA